MSMTNWLEDELAKWCAGQANALDDGLVTPYIALFTSAPTEAGGGTECADATYARQSAAGKFAAPSGGVIVTNAEVLFPAMTTGATIVGAALMTAVTAGTMLRYQDAGLGFVSKVIGAGIQPRFVAGAISFGGN